MNNKQRYHPDWLDVIRPAILKRDKYVCTKCGARHKKTYVFDKDGTKFIIPKEELEAWKDFGDKAYTVYLQIAHLDRNPENNEFSNLKCFCPKCHLNYDRQHNNLIRKGKLK